MKTFKGICLKDTVFLDGENKFSLKRGSEYIISLANDKGEVTVFSKYWISGVSINLFGGLIPGLGNKHEPSNS